MLRSYKLGVLGFNVLAGGLFLSFTRSFRRFEEFIVIEQKITLSQLKSQLLPLRSPYAPLIHMQGSSIHLAQVPSYRHTSFKYTRSWNSKVEDRASISKSVAHIWKVNSSVRHSLQRQSFSAFPATLFPSTLSLNPVSH
jgi:hypothetical protein